MPYHGLHRLLAVLVGPVATVDDGDVSSGGNVGECVDPAGYEASVPGRKERRWFQAPCNQEGSWKVQEHA